LAVLLILGFLLTSCGPSDAQIEELLATPVQEKVTVKWLLVGEGTEPWMQSASNDFVSRFNASQEEIELDITTASGFGGFSDQIEAGNIPDVVGPLTPGFGARFNDVWADIDALAVEGANLDAFDPSTLDAWRRNGKLIGIPFGYWPAVLFYNKDIFDKAGLPYPPHKYDEAYADGGAWDLNKVAEIGPMMTLDKQGNSARSPGFDPNQAVQWGFVLDGDLRAAAAIFGTADLLGAGGEVKLPQSWREAFYWMHDALWDGKFFPNEVGYQRTRGDPFGTGAAAMYYAPTYFYCCQEKFNWDIAAVPSWAGKATARRDHSGFGIPIASQNQEAALKVIMAMTKDPALLAAYRIVPARTELRSDLVKNLSAAQPYVDWQVVADSIDHPDDPPYSQFLPGAGGAYERLNQFVEGLLTNPDFDVDAELDRLETDLQAIVGQN
jgi:multiple sugar transport system substrate-binding protein